MMRATALSIVLAAGCRVAAPAAAAPTPHGARATSAAASKPLAAPPSRVRTVATQPQATQPRATQPRAAPAPSQARPGLPTDTGNGSPEAALPPPLPRGTVVLHVGDSMADALGKALNHELAERGIKGYLEAREATYIPEWAGFKMQLPELLARRKPDLVLITLGGNELKMPDPTERVGAIKRLVAMVGDRPCLWIAAPLWPGLKSTGLLEIIADHCAPCRFVDTNTLISDLERLADHVHPTIAERRRWARFMIRWMLQNRDPDGPRPWSFKRHLEPPPPESASWLEQR